MPATLEQPTADIQLAKPEKATVYFSRRRDLKLVLKPERKRSDAEGNVVEVIPGERVKFEEGVLRVPFAGHVRGEQGERLDPQRVVKFLEGDAEGGLPPHQLLGDREEGFWRHEEAAPVPTAEERELLSELTIELDVDGLQAFIDAENAGWKRPELLELAGAAHKRASEKRAETDRQMAEAEARGAAAAVAKRPKPQNVPAA